MVTTHKNNEAVEDLVCSQEDQPVTHMHPRDIAKELGIVHSFVCMKIKTKGIKQFKHLTTPYMNDATRTKRVEHKSVLLEKFKKKPSVIKGVVFQDESDLLFIDK